jgi:hypothetical protein
MKGYMKNKPGQGASLYCGLKAKTDYEKYECKGCMQESKGPEALHSIWLFNWTSENIRASVSSKF